MTRRYLACLALTASAAALACLACPPRVTARPLDLTAHARAAPVFLPAVPWSPRAKVAGARGTDGAPPPAVLRGLAPEDRKNVVLLDGDGVVYASHISQARGLEAPTKVGGNLYRSDAGETFAAPAQLPPGLRARGDDVYGISKDRRTGPYHGVYAKPGYAFEEATVHLSSNALTPPDIHVSGASASDTPFVYMGGEGARGGAVDAGFQYSPAHDNWSLFIMAEGFGYVGYDGKRFKSDQDVHLKFYVPADNCVAVAASGVDEDGQPATQTLALDMTRYPDNGHAPAGRAGQPTRFGWSAHGGGNVLKRLTSIAQKAQAFDTRSYTRGIRWSDVRLGTGPDEARPWTAGDTGETFNWPDRMHIVVRTRSADDETVSIQLNRFAR